MDEKTKKWSEEMNVLLDEIREINEALITSQSNRMKMYEMTPDELAELMEGEFQFQQKLSYYLSTRPHNVVLGNMEIAH